MSHCLFHVRDSLPWGHDFRNKNNRYNFPKLGLEICGLEGQWEVTFRPLIQTVYIRIYMGKTVYIRIMAYIYASYNSHTVYTNTGTEKFYLYILIYTVRIYTAYIYLYGLGQPYKCTMELEGHTHTHSLSLSLSLSLSFSLREARTHIQTYTVYAP